MQVQRSQNIDTSVWQRKKEFKKIFPSPEAGPSLSTGVSPRACPSTIAVTSPWLATQGIPPFLHDLPILHTFLFPEKSNNSQWSKDLNSGQTQICLPKIMCHQDMYWAVLASRSVAEQCVSSSGDQSREILFPSAPRRLPGRNGHLFHFQQNLDRLIGLPHT